MAGPWQRQNAATAESPGGHLKLYSPHLQPAILSAYGEQDPGTAALCVLSVVKVLSVLFRSTAPRPDTREPPVSKGPRSLAQHFRPGRRSEFSAIFNSSILCSDVHCRRRIQNSRSADLPTPQPLTPNRSKSTAFHQSPARAFFGNLCSYVPYLRFTLQFAHSLPLQMIPACPVLTFRIDPFKTPDRVITSTVAENATA